MKNDTVEKISKILETCSREEYEKIMFPKKASFEDFKQLIKYEQKKRDMFMAHDVIKIKIQILMNFFKKLKDESLHDIAFDQLYEDRYKLTKKIDRGNNILDDLTEIWDKKIRDSDIEKICHAYAQNYERFCKRYLKPLSSKIVKKNITKCGIAIDIITKYYPDTAKLIKPCMISQIRNSIDHSDYVYDKKRNVISFDDEKKPTIELSPEQLKIIIHLMMENETCFSIAEFNIKESLLKTIVVESEKCEKFCKILGLNFDVIMMKYLGQGYSLFEVNWKLEQYIKHNIKSNAHIG